MKYPAYPKYKASGVEWLGDVPEHWGTKRLRHISNEITVGVVVNPSSYVADEGVPFLLGGDIREFKISTANCNRCLPESSDGPLRKSRLSPEDIVVVRVGYPGVTAVVPPELDGANCASMMIVRRHHRFCSQWFAYVMNSQVGRDQIEIVQYGAAQKQFNISHAVDFSFPFPPLSEQRAIADFLDAQTAKLDTLLAKKRALIETLREQRTALISQTVTRGLPADAARAAGFAPQPKLKPSGIEWLGDVPEHWEVAHLSRKWLVMDCKHRTVPFVDEGIPLASIGEVKNLTVNLSNANKTTEEEYLQMIEGGRKPVIGDIIFSRNATVGEAAIVATDERFCMGQDVCLIRSKTQEPKFFLYLTRSTSLIQQIESLMIGSTFKRINVGQIKTFWITYPPLEEQRAIAAYLDRETARIDRMIEKVAAASERLQEYRTALITAVVTGRIDVREVTG